MKTANGQTQFPHRDGINDPKAPNDETGEWNEVQGHMKHHLEDNVACFTPDTMAGITPVRGRGLSGQCQWIMDEYDTIRSNKKYVRPNRVKQNPVTQVPILSWKILGAKNINQRKPRIFTLKSEEVSSHLCLSPNSWVLGLSPKDLSPFPPLKIAIVYSLCASLQTQFLPLNPNL